MDEQLFAAKISELKKLKKMFRDVTTLFNDPLEKENPTLARDAFNEASERVHQQSYKRSRQTIVRPANKRLHSNDIYCDDNIRQSIEDSIRREAEIIYRAKDPTYAKAVDAKDVEFDNLLAEIEQSYYFLHDIFQQYHWVKGTILSGDFGYLRKHARSIRKKWFVGEITEAVDIIDKIQNAMEREKPNSLQVDGGDKSDVLSLHQFMEQRCEAEGIDIPVRVKSLRRMHKDKLIALPELARPYQRGRANVYYALELIAGWGEYQRQVPLLPKLK